MNPACKKLSDTASATIESDRVREWLDLFASYVRERNFSAARQMFAHDVVSFGSWTGRMDGLETLIAQQWKNVWPETAGFDFDPDHAAGEQATGGEAPGETTWAAATWSSQALHPDGTPHFTRRGRATFVFRRVGERLLAVHTHFSLDPAGRL